VPHRHHGLQTESSPPKRAQRSARRRGLCERSGNAQPASSYQNTEEIPLYLADPAAQQRKQKASRTEEQIKEHLLKRSIYRKEKRKNFTDEERKRASAMTMENRRKHKARWTSEERAENRMKEAAAEKNRRDS
jgi:hypothetical protein